MIKVAQDNTYKTMSNAEKKLGGMPQYKLIGRIINKLIATGMISKNIRLILSVTVKPSSQEEQGCGRRMLFRIEENDSVDSQCGHFIKQT